MTNALVAVVGIVLIVGILFAPSVVCWLKGKRWWATLGFFTGWHWIPVFRLAKPNSWWAPVLRRREAAACQSPLRLGWSGSRRPVDGPGTPARNLDRVLGGRD